ncbi:MAG: hemolysin family protein [Bacteroidales bacterium]|nr:hemolysin family protein [Bacteroidales bacterium]MCF8337536.1 hemolysin family protein [Bacteroidales bacterium]
MKLLILYLFIALGFSFLCSLLEAVILSITPSHVNMLSEKGGNKGKLIKRFKDNIDRPLSAILTLNTFAHTIGAAGVGAQAQVIWGNEALSITSAVLTILILIVSEIIPKTLGALYWKNLVGFTAYTLLILIYSPLYPFILISQQITKWLKGGRKDQPVSRDELSSLARLGAISGVFKKKESLMIENLMKFEHIKVKDIMTPRVVVASENEKTKVGDMKDRVADIPFSRIPVYQEHRENISGYILKDDLMLNLVHQKGGKQLRSLKRPIPLVVDSLPLSSLYEKFIAEKDIIAMVVDEYGGMSGIVTMEDLIETILGLEIVDEYDNIENLRKMARERWEKRAKWFTPPNANQENRENKGV